MTTVDARTEGTRYLAVFSIQLASMAALCTALFGPAWLVRPATGLALTVMFGLFLVGFIYARSAINQANRERELLDEAQVSKQRVDDLLCEAQASRLQVENLFAMTDMLQAAEDHEDAGAVLMATGQRLLPDFAGALYVFNNSRDRLDLAKAWNETENFKSVETLLPSHCWALKRGKVHINDCSKHALICTHQMGNAATIEMPMMARGQVFGLLVLSAVGEDAVERLKEADRVARALADSISLALSNISLRERLRTQSLLDPLTGLYNRRYMEDALERYISLAERTGDATSVVMIDLDNFKHINDEHGHAKGDAILRDVAGQLVAALKPCDVVARYGGEELLVILPNCGLEDATAKADLLRLRIASLTDAHGFPVSASFGVASVPETSSSASDVIPIADAALYAAKQAGKNCVAPADRRACSGAKDQNRLVT